MFLSIWFYIVLLIPICQLMLKNFCFFIQVAFKIFAYVHVMGISTEAVIDVSNKGFKFFVAGSLFKLIEANVTVEAPYGNGNIFESQFSVRLF